jgi:hypothetical protein
MDSMYEWYGKDKVEFLKIDGNIAHRISNFYNVNAYPLIFAIKPG